MGTGVLKFFMQYKKFVLMKVWRTVSAHKIIGPMGL